ncbi:MAG: hypothetical protein CND89_05605 [Marine Group II euryarchaeote MED-G38]|nr:hypothetical protein [Euryarchaeota archaeon]OUV27196.1 MAG: hypothetical protein CBC57_01150 [Euryarchaeota archaeon TMED97]PDH21822.1 MAG: hypothetical protein CND89_05605 [Marine Group II euryarchaeote MED-G38]
MTILNTITAALFAGFVAIAVTLLIERYGGAIGGILGTIPTTIVPAAAGMALATNDTDLNISLAIVPAGMLINGLFLVNWKILPTYFNNTEKIYTTLFTITIISLSIWSLSGLVILRIIELGYDSSLSSFEIGLLGQSLLVILGVGMSWRIDSTPRGKNKVNKYVLFSRGIMAAFAIGVAVWISSLGYSLLAGLASVFPAIFLTSMVALWISQGPSVPMGAAGPMILGGASVGVYAIIAMWSLPNFGIFLGSLIAWFLAVILWSVPCFQFVKWRQSILN